MPTATEHDPLPLPDYGLEYGSLDKDIAARVRQLKKHAKHARAKKRREDAPGIFVAMIFLAWLAGAAYVTPPFLHWLHSPITSPYQGESALTEVTYSFNQSHH